MIKLFIYPNAKKPFETFTDEHLSFLKNTTIFSEDGLKKYCNIVSPEEADYYYMGQVSCGTFSTLSPYDFKYLKGNERKHIVELEGDWYQKRVPQWLLDCICMGNSYRTYYNPYLFFVRPCMSRLLVHLARNNIEYDSTLSDSVSFGFKGQQDPYGTRLKLYNILNKANIKNEFYFNNRWCSQVDLKKDNDVVQSFAGVLKRNILSLCPRGAGEDSSRFYETCFFGRVPVIVGHCKVLDEDVFNKKFYFRIPPDISDSEMTDELLKIYNTPTNELKEMCTNAKTYFETNIKNYFKDPTGYFLGYLNEKSS
jgi:hypothetical protein